MMGKLKISELAAIIGGVSSVIMIIFYIVYTPQVVWVEQSGGICPEKLSFSYMYRSGSFEMKAHNGGMLPANIVVCISSDTNGITILKQCKAYWVDAKQDAPFNFPLTLSEKNRPKSITIEVNAYCYWARPLNFLPCIGNSAICKYKQSKYSPNEYELVVD